MSIRFPSGGFGTAVAPAAGVVADGVTDNYGALMAALEALPHGGAALLPPGPVGTSKTVVPPEGTHLVSLAPARINYPEGPYFGTVLVGTPGSKLAEVIALTNNDSGLKNVGANAIPGEGAEGILLDAERLTLSYVRAQGAKGGHAAITSTSKALSANLDWVVARGYSGSTNPALIVKGPDWIVSHLRTLGPTKIEASGGVWSGCHPVCNASNGGPNLIISGQTSFTGCYIDGTAEGCLVEVLSGRISFVGGRFYQNAGVSGIPIIKPNGNVVIVDGVTVPANGEANRFSALADNAVGMKPQNLELEGQAVEKLWLEGNPSSMRDVRMNGVEQATVSGAPLTVLNGTTSGAARWSMPQQGANEKKVKIYLDEYKNASAEAQKIVFPVEFVKSPIFVGGNTTTPDSGHTITGTFTLAKGSLTLPKEMAGALTDWIIIEGY